MLPYVFTLTLGESRSPVTSAVADAPVSCSTTPSGTRVADPPKRLPTSTMIRRGMAMAKNSSRGSREPARVMLRAMAHALPRSGVTGRSPSRSAG